MKRTALVLGFFLAAVVVGLFLRFAVPPTTTLQKEIPDASVQSMAKETFFQREKGMPVSTGEPEPMAGTCGSPPLLSGSEPKPLPLRPYEIANDSELFMFQGNRVGAECCPSAITSDMGCVCVNDDQAKLFASRGGNRLV